MLKTLEANKLYAQLIAHSLSRNGKRKLYTLISQIMNSFRLYIYIYIIIYIHNNFCSFYFLPINDMNNIIEHKMSVIGP